MEGRSAAYRGATREEAQEKYHEAARVAAAEGYAPTSEEWSTEMGEQVLTVTFAYLPDQAPAVLAALGTIDPPLPAPPSPVATWFAAPAIQGATDPATGSRWSSVVATVEDRFPALKGRVPLAAGIGAGVVAVAFLLFVLGGKPSGTAGGAPTQPPAATVQPTPSSKLATSNIGYTASAEVGGNIRLRFTITNLGLTTSSPIRAQVSGMQSVADATDCVPACTKSDTSGDLAFDFSDTLTPGQSVSYEINFAATTAGVADWKITLQEGQSVDFYKGGGAITIK
jgi:hypothetical protein